MPSGRRITDGSWINVQLPSQGKGSGHVACRVLILIGLASRVESKEASTDVNINLCIIIARDQQTGKKARSQILYGDEEFKDIARLI